MGSYSELKFGTIELASIKNDYDPYLLFLFQESDKSVTHTTVDEGGWSDHYGDWPGDTPITLVVYSCSASIVRERLELMGYTKAVAEQGFYKGLKVSVQRYEEYLQTKGYENLSDQLNTILTVLESLTHIEWIKGFEEIQRNKYARTMWRLEDSEAYPPLLRYMLTEDWFGFPGYNTLIFLRLIIDSFSDEEKLIYDFTDLANGGWVDEAEDLIGMLDDQVSATYSASRRFIIMTEGSSDSWILQRSLKLLYPHLFDYFKFLDFEGAKIGGGAGMLANSIKAFAGAGILNRIIALFDNDTAASAAIRTLANVDLPRNIQVKQYPYLALADNYPTIGPTGLINTNVNGLACSIELYLGRDILMNESSEFSPIQWRGYDTGMKQYQGEIIDKLDIQKKFDKKLEICEKDYNRIKDFDWYGIYLIISTILTAFNEEDASLILADENAFG